MPIHYIDLENGDDAADGSTFALGGLPTTGPWKTITDGATAARIAPGDVIRISKTPDPVSIGNGTWTNLSATVTLASAQTATVDNCESIWTANGSGDTTVSLETTERKQGTYSMEFLLDSAPQTSTMQAYFQISDTDFSSYQKLSFWFLQNATISADEWYIALCSDTAGATPVDVFKIPTIADTDEWIPLTLTKDGGGNLGASIQSIAIYTDTSAPVASSTVWIDNVIACTTTGLNLQSLISKNTLAQGGSEGWWAIQSIDGTTVLLDRGPDANPSEVSGYFGTSETVTTYQRETFKTTLQPSVTSNAQVINDSGTVGAEIEYQGGWDTGTTTQDGETFFDGLNGNGYGLYSSTKNYIKINYISLYRYYKGLVLTNSNFQTVTNIGNCNNANNNIDFNTCEYINASITNSNSSAGYGLGLSGVYNSIFTIAALNSNYRGIFLDDVNDVDFYITQNRNNQYAFFCLTNGVNIKIYGGTYSDNTTSTIAGRTGNITFFNPIVNDTAFSSFDARNSNNLLGVHNLDATLNNHWLFSNYIECNLQNTTIQQVSGYAWKISVLNTVRNSLYKFPFPMAKVLCTSGETTTVKVYCKKDAASTVQATLRNGSTWLAGVTEQTDTKADDTNWEQLSISFTPTENGVVEIYGDIWCTDITNANVYWDTMEITSV